MKIKLLALLTTIGIAMSAQAQQSEIYISAADVSKWRVQTYTSSTTDVLSMWFTGSSCTNGQLLFPSTVAAEKNRFWSTVMAAKLANKKMFISYYFNSSAGTCIIASYALLEE